MFPAPPPPHCHTRIENIPSLRFQSSPQGSQYKQTTLPEDLPVLGLAPPDSVVSL